MYSFLHEIRDYVSEKGISFSGIFLDKDSFPKYFNLYIWNKLLEIVGDSSKNVEIDGYSLICDNGNIYLEVECSSLALGQRVLIVNGEDRVSFNEEYHIFSERLLIKNINKLMRSLSFHFRTCVHSEDLLEYKKWDSRDMEIQLKESALKCINCISFINDAYKNKLVEEIKDEEHRGIYYSEPDKIGESRTIENIHGCKERVNEIIPINDRISVLDGFPYLYKEYAYNGISGGINYLCYLYKVSDTRYALVLEPFGGTNYTKVAIINRKEDISFDDFLVLAKGYLELSFNESKKASELLRLAHTSISVFENNIRFFVQGGISGKKISGYIKKRINEIDDNK